MHIEVFTEFCKVIHTYTCSFLFYRVIEVECLGRKEGEVDRQATASALTDRILVTQLGIWKISALTENQTLR